MKANHSQLNKYASTSSKYQIIIHWLRNLAKEASNAISLRAKGISLKEGFYQI